MADCDHYWIPSNVLPNGEPDFRKGPVSKDPVAHVTCKKCNVRTWFTYRQWHDIPVRGSDDGR